MIIFLIFIFGIIFGSFLNVLIYRLPLGHRGVIKGRSYCPKCGKTLRWHELIPVFSFFLLGGKCGGCKAKLSWQYPAIEIISGLLWIAVFYHNLNGNFQSIFNFQFLNFIYETFILSALLVVALIDARMMIIPDKVVYSATVISLFYNLSQAVVYNNFREYFLWPILTAGAAFLFFFAFYFFSKGRSMGLGDAKLAVLIGLFLSPAQTLVGFFGAFALGALFGIILMALGRKTFRSQLAFGPFLAAGTLIAYLIPWTYFLNFLESLIIKFY